MHQCLAIGATLAVMLGLHSATASTEATILTQEVQRVPTRISDLAADQEPEPSFDGKSLSYWLDRLTHTHYLERKRAAEAVIRIGPPAKDAVPDLIRMLRSEKDGVMLGLAAKALGAIGPAAKEAVPTLADALERATPGHMSPGVATARALVQIRERDAVPILLPLLRHDREYVRRCAADAMVLIAPDDELTLAAVVVLLKNSDKGIRETAAWLAKHLRPISKFVVPPLIEALESSASHVRYDAARDLGDIGSDAKAAIPMLTKLLRDDYVRLTAAEALWKIEGDADKLLPILVKSLESQVTEERRKATYCLELVGAHAQNAVSALIDALSDEDHLVRSSAARAIGSIGPGAKGALPRLRQAVSDEDSRTRIEAATAIWKISGDRELAQQVFVRSLRAREHDSFIAAKRLGEIGPQARDVIPVLDDALRDNRGLVSVHAAHALWNIERDIAKVLPVLVEYLADPARQGEYQAAVEALAEIGTPAKPALAHLTRGLRYPDVRTRQLVAKAIARIDPHVAPDENEDTFHSP